MKQTNGRIQSDANRVVKRVELVMTGILFLFLSLPAVSQNQSSGDVSGKTGTVTADQVRLRGGPGTNYKQVGMVDQGKKLRVKRKQGKWLEVAPPAEARVWVYGQYVEKIDESTGKVTGTDVNVRPLPRADQTNMPVGQLSSPDRVVITDSKKGDADEHPWYQIRMPEGLNPWIHSKFVDFGSGEESGPVNRTDRPDEQPEGTGQSADQAPDGEADENGAPPQKGTSAQKGGVQNGGGETTETTGGTIGAPGAPEKWVNRLESIQQEVRDERAKENKLQWDFSNQIQSLNSYIENCPNSRLASQATQLREKLNEVQSSVQKQRERLNKRLKEIKEERKEQVRNTIQDVLEAKGFEWDVVGHVKSVGNLYVQPPGEYELVKGNERVYFLTSGRSILKLENYRGLQVAISGNEKPVHSTRWDVPLMEVMKIEVVK